MVIFALHKNEHSIAIGVAGNKPSRIAMVQLAMILLCASNGTLNADSLMEKMIPSRLVNMVLTLVHYFCLPGCGAEMEFQEGSVYQGMRIISIDIHGLEENAASSHQHPHVSRATNSKCNLPEPTRSNAS